MSIFFDHRFVPATRWPIFECVTKRFWIGVATVLACQAGAAIGAVPPIEGHFLFRTNQDSQSPNVLTKGNGR